jgi:hypothetical protein
MDDNQIKSHIQSAIDGWCVAGGALLDDKRSAFLAAIIFGKMRDAKIPFDALDKIFSSAMAIYSKPTLPNFLKSWDGIKDDYWAAKEKNAERNFDESRDQTSPIVGISWERYLFYSECVRIRLGIVSMIPNGHPMRRRQLELLQMAGGLPEMPSDKEDQIVRHWIRSLPTGFADAIWRSWQASVAPLRARQVSV